MNKGTIIRLSFLLPLAFNFSLQGCGGGGGDGDNDNLNNTDTDNNTTENSLSSNIWMTSDCIQDNAGVYYKSLYEFTTNGTILYGYQDYQDTSCATPKTETTLPELDLGTYTTGETRTLQDGANGTVISLLLNDGTINGTFTTTSQNTLCFSSNLSINTQGISNMGGSAEQVDYDHCLSIHSTATDPGQNPNPNPNPDTSSNALLGRWLNLNSCMPDNNGGYYLIAYKFTEENRVLFAYAPYENNTCLGDSSFSDFFEFSSPMTYIDQGETTLSDGTQGYSLQITFGSETATGYYTFDSQNRLCVSYNLGLTVLEDSESTNINYSNCMVSAERL